MSNKFPLALISITSMTILTVTGCLAPEDALANFANESVIIVGAMMIIAAGLNRTQMLHKVTNLVFKISGGSFTKGMLGYCLVTFAVAQIMPSATVIFAICAPLTADFCRRSGKSPSVGLFSVALVAITAVCAMPIGNGAANYVMVNSQMASYGITGYESKLFDFFIVKIPSLIVAVICGTFICPRFAPDHETSVGENEKKMVQNEIPPLDSVREVFGYGIFLVVLVCILLGDLIPLKLWEICVIGALLEVFTGVLNEKEALSSINLSPIFLLIGGLGLGSAVVNSGAGDVIASMIQNILGDSPNPWMAAIIFWLTAFILTQFMSNLAVMYGMTPLVYVVCMSYNWNPIGLVYLFWTACFLGYLTPLSTPAIPYMMGMGSYTQKDLLKMGWVPLY